MSQATKTAADGYSRCKGGKRDDLGGKYFRSGWEANYARYLNWLIDLDEIVQWEYEPEVFEFAGIKRGTTFYVPDFRITNRDGSTEYHEIKGWMDKRSQTKLNRMKKYHPEVNLILVDSDAYKKLARDVRPFIPNWE
jgi:predicted nuclease of restriction endonuclease-like RecB superfamily